MPHVGQQVRAVEGAMTKPATCGKLGAADI